MKANKMKILAWLLIISILLSGCGPGQLLGPTITPSPTFTLTPTITPSPTPTLTVTPSPTVTQHPTSTPIQVIIDAGTLRIEVTNDSDVLNGNTNSISALISQPGGDGISFREALIASNNTSGPKAIEFAPVLVGATITFSKRELLRLSSGGLTINGDINQDGIPDITLDGHLGQRGTPTAPGLSIVSSDNTVSGLNLSDFASAAILITCPDIACGTKLFRNNKIISNTISSPRGGGIDIGPLSLRPASEAPVLSDITWQDTIISGNTISSTSQTMFINAAVGGGSRNRIINLTISGNHLLSNAEVVLGVVVADVNSTYFSIPGPIQYSDNNRIENLTISDNIIEAPNGFGIHIGGANYGNSDNSLQNTKITNNTISNVQIAAIELTAGNGGSGDRGSNNNLITDVEISDNIIAHTEKGISIRGAFVGTTTDVGSANNRIERVLIADNRIRNYTEIGIEIEGARSSSSDLSDNVLDQITVLRNHISQTDIQGSGIGIELIGARSFDGLAHRNTLQDVHILNNDISHSNIGIQIFGGYGIGAEDNQVTIEEILNNTISTNSVPSQIQNNYAGAKGNQVITIHAQSESPHPSKPSIDLVSSRRPTQRAPDW